MAVEATHAQGSARSTARRFLVGTNVVVAIVLVVAVVVIAQLIAFKTPVRWDVTHSGVNSLSDGTESLLRSLDSQVRLTSLYFETDREDEDQQRFRRAAKDLLDLYAATNRAKVQAEWINPLKDHGKFKELMNRLSQVPSLGGEIASYKERIDRFTNELDDEMLALVGKELETIGGFGSSFAGSQSVARSISLVQDSLAKLKQVLEGSSKQIDALVQAETPQYTAAVNELKTLYRDMAASLKNIADYASAQANDESLSADQSEYLAGCGNRFATTVASLEAETTKLQDSKPLKLDDLMRELGPTANPILVETADDAMVVDFSSVWPPLDQRGGGRLGFKDRAFKGEEKLTSAILRATHKEQTAVVFVRYGGTPLLTGGFMPRQPPAPYSAMKRQLEDANFIVSEWDIKASMTPPEIDPVPTRTIYVVMKPTAPPRDPMGRPSQEPPFTDSHKKAVIDAVKASGRALFIAGWHPGPFGPIPATYEYGDYLKDEWGVEVDTSALLIETMNIGPGKYTVARGASPITMRNLSVAEHDIVTGATARQLALPLCAPLNLDDSPPDSVELWPLVHLNPKDGIWGETDLMGLQNQGQTQEYMTRGDDDLLGPFDLAVAGAKGEAKVVVVSSAEFANDQVAFARAFAMTSQGITVRSQNPGNVTLLINSMHWLNDNSDFMNIGKPIDAAVLQIESESTVKAVQALTIFGWPALSLVVGGIVWWVRRR